MRTRNRLIPSPTLIARSTDLPSVYSLLGGSFRLCAGRSQWFKASAVNGTIGSSTARCWSSTRCVPWPRASSARAQSRRSRDWPPQQRTGRGGFSLSTFDAPKVSPSDCVDENARFKWQTLRASHAALGIVGLVRWDRRPEERDARVRHFVRLCSRCADEIDMST